MWYDKGWISTPHNHAKAKTKQLDRMFQALDHNMSDASTHPFWSKEQMKGKLFGGDLGSAFTTTSILFFADNDFVWKNLDVWKNCFIKSPP